MEETFNLSTYQLELSKSLASILLTSHNCLTLFRVPTITSLVLIIFLKNHWMPKMLNMTADFLFSPPSPPRYMKRA
jgi:hypothetical protein